MKYVLLTLAALALVPAASATSVTYATTGELCLGASGCANTAVNFDQGGGNILTLTFGGLGATVDPGGPGNFTFNSLGSLTISCVGTCAQQSLVGYNLYITIDQTAPTAGTQTMVAGVLTGSIGVASSSALVTWSNPNTVTIDPFSYSIANNPLALVPANTNGGVTSIQGLIQEFDVPSDIPEPATYLMLSAGLLGLGIRRKFAKRS